MLCAHIVALIILSKMTKNDKKSIILIGPMGVGKTSIGHRLAYVLRYDFYDSDSELVERTGVSINHIFKVEGETGFRRRESKMLKELCQLKNSVIATGGGIVTVLENRQLLQKHNPVIYLKSSLTTLLERTAKSNHRPLLENSANREKTITDLLKVRNPWYQQCANITIDTSGKRLYMIINEIKKKLCS